MLLTPPRSFSATETPRRIADRIPPVFVHSLECYYCEPSGAARSASPLSRDRESSCYAISPHMAATGSFVEIRHHLKIAKPQPRSLVASNSDFIANPNGRFNGGEQRSSKKFPRGCGLLEFIQPVFTQLQYCHDFFDVFAELGTSGQI